MRYSTSFVLQFGGATNPAVASKFHQFFLATDRPSARAIDSARERGEHRAEGITHQQWAPGRYRNFNGRFS